MRFRIAALSVFLLSVSCDADEEVASSVPSSTLEMADFGRDSCDPELTLSCYYPQAGISDRQSFRLSSGSLVSTEPSSSRDERAVATDHMDCLAKIMKPDVLKTLKREMDVERRRREVQAMVGELQELRAGLEELEKESEASFKEAKRREKAFTKGERAFLDAQRSAVVETQAAQFEARILELNRALESVAQVEPNRTYKPTSEEFQCLVSVDQMLVAILSTHWEDDGPSVVLLALARPSDFDRWEGSGGLEFDVGEFKCFMRLAQRPPFSGKGTWLQTGPKTGPKPATAHIFEATCRPN